MQSEIHTFAEELDLPVPDSSTNHHSDLNHHHDGLPQELNSVQAQTHKLASSPTPIGSFEFPSASIQPLPALLSDDSAPSTTQAIGMNQNFSAAPSQVSTQDPQIPSSFSFISPDSMPAQQTIFLPDPSAASVLSPTYSSLGPPSIDLNLNSPLTPGSYNRIHTDLSFSPSPLANKDNSYYIQSQGLMPFQDLPSTSQRDPVSKNNVPYEAQMPHHDRNQSLPNGFTQEYDSKYAHRVSLNRAATISESSRPTSGSSTVRVPTNSIPDQSFQFPANPSSQPIHSDPQPIAQITIPDFGYYDSTNLSDPQNQSFQFSVNGPAAPLPPNLSQFQLQPPPIQSDGGFQFPQQHQITIPDISDTFSQATPASGGGFEITIPDLDALEAVSTPIVIPESFSAIDIDPSIQIPQQQQPSFPQNPEDVQSTLRFGQGSAHTQPTASRSLSMEHNSPASAVANAAPNSEELKSSSEYALHILFTQVSIILFFYC